MELTVTLRKMRNTVDTISQFNEFYFEDENRIRLFVYLSALYDNEIMVHLEDAFQVASIPDPTEDDIKCKVDLIIKGGT